MEITFAKAVNLALFDALQEDAAVRVFGLGVTDANGVFGTTAGLREQFGSDRVFDIPLSENAVTGAAVGMAMMGLRPVMTHQRADFTFTSAEQIINQAAKTFFTSGGKFPVPMVIRMIVGRGWGQGPTHAQSPHALYATVPGLKIVMPATPEDAYGMLLNAVRDPNPVLFIEHRWLHEISSTFSKSVVDISLIKSLIVKSGTQLTLAGVSYGLIEALKVSTVLEKLDVSVEVLNLRSVAPLDQSTILTSVRKTGKFAFIDIAPIAHGIGGEISSVISKNLWGKIKHPPLSLGMRFFPVPSSPYLANNVYPTPLDLITSVENHFNFGIDLGLAAQLLQDLFPAKSDLRDQPDVGRVGPF